MIRDGIYLRNFFTSLAEGWKNFAFLKNIWSLTIFTDLFPSSDPLIDPVHLIWEKQALDQVT